MYESNKYEWILSVGIPLHQDYVSDWALTYEQAVEVLNEFRFFKISVLGGEVYEYFNDALQMNYDSWGLERELNETDESFLLKSINTSLKYVENYEKNIKTGCFYTICPGPFVPREKEVGKVINSTPADRLGYIVSLLDGYLKPQDVKVIKEFNANNNPSLAVEVLVMILIDARIEITRRTYKEILRILNDLEIDTSIAKALSGLVKCRESSNL